MGRRGRVRSSTRPPALRMGRHVLIFESHDRSVPHAARARRTLGGIRQHLGCKELSRLGAHERPTVSHELPEGSNPRGGRRYLNGKAAPGIGERPAAELALGKARHDERRTAMRAHELGQDRNLARGRYCAAARFIESNRHASSVPPFGLLDTTLAARADRTSQPAHNARTQRAAPPTRGRPSLTLLPFYSTSPASRTRSGYGRAGADATRRASP